MVLLPVAFVTVSSWPISHSAYSAPRQLPSSALHAVLPQANPHQQVVSSALSPFQLGNEQGPIEQGVHRWLENLVPSASAAETVKPPTDAEVKLLREALGAIYGERNPAKAEELLGKAIDAWERQKPDERAALYRVRGDCYMELLRAEDAATDYGKAIALLEGPGGELADPGERPAARLGRARALRSTGKLTQELSAQAAQDYQIAIRLSSREDWGSDEENEEDGAARNPFATWEWAMTRRDAGDYAGAAKTHNLASTSFADIGDKARSVISALDAGIDWAATNDIDMATTTLDRAIKSTTSVEGRDIPLLQRVIAKECEARVAFASVLWDSGDRAEAERQLGEACLRLDQLEADSDAREATAERANGGAVSSPKLQKLVFSIDDSIGAGDLVCSRFKNEEFLGNTLMWPQSLKSKVLKLERLQK